MERSFWVWEELDYMYVRNLIAMPVYFYKLNYMYNPEYFILEQTEYM